MEDLEFLCTVRVWYERKMRLSRLMFVYVVSQLSPTIILCVWLLFMLSLNSLQPLYCVCVIFVYVVPWFSPTNILCACDFCLCYISILSDQCTVYMTCLCCLSILSDHYTVCVIFEAKQDSPSRFISKVSADHFAAITYIQFFFCCNLTQTRVKTQTTYLFSWKTFE